MDIIVLISIAQILIAIFLVVFILLQQRGAALGSAFGGDGGGFYGARRGLQKQLYWSTIVLGTLFIGLALLRLILSA
ncbi:MAG: preprotein translocase subunit SecG [Candidatus Wildermuthbacteria bacterium RIFCSPLOWO2_02_FULL_47_9c]|uniref:Protein-export membrane protein SecG n=2 Tax=Parcubacteria group TaxID=1794811 RepID=A0A837IKC2_9BACT|nr:MAG: preprotein translocase, SecG subunit, preprotein translocase subunit SecG [Candidatus Yanofskybacteria bacterium GW2011_GWC1_48_11]KKW03389.1 MAG: Preprotein translocase, SecG subunit [Parcubacteria group bacterium GW2011_GWB1_49_12]KKW08319.1 MAG: Preprotein translocase, SecG subunit [Parcubacteria group bacterium GW2011_GWA1_49_26]KKW13786.1 MAG: Preprotein translocase, SecG subunit [Parcubacteria group bacterium GW2011_GWA2_50_10]OHA61900.1 MAG: preprotein translocase subunit SecG [C